MSFRYLYGTSLEQPLGLGGVDSYDPYQRKIYCIAAADCTALAPAAAHLPSVPSV